MPAKERYGAQPPIELLRQCADQGGWYDAKALIFKQLLDVSFVGAMVPPGGGRTKFTDRYLRHFSVIGVVPYDDASLERIFGTIVPWWLHRFLYVSHMAQDLVTTSILLYRQLCTGLMPTPAKSHYTFNLRDLCKVVGGMMLCPQINTEVALARLFIHEVSRVFQDRLVSHDDRDWLEGQVRYVTRRT